MAKIDVLTLTGRKSGKMELPEEIFAVRVNPQLIAQAVRVYLANQRRAKAKTKTRGEVSGSRRKIWRQKGTGRARHGDRYAPIFVGGGVAHGPTGKENYRLRMTKKMKRRALFASLTRKFKNKEILVVKGLEKIEPKTKKMMRVLKDLKLDSLPFSDRARKKRKTSSQTKKGKMISLILPRNLENVIRAARNIPTLRLLQADQLNTYEILRSNRLLFMKDSIAKLKETFLKD